MERKRLVDQSIDFILRHLDEPLSLDVLAEQAHLSKYHFSRIFKGETGESVYAFIKRCRVDQSAVDLKLDPARTVTEIGLDYGYSASNFSSVFRQHHAASPAGFRRSLPAGHMAVPFAPERVARFQTAEEYAARIEIRQMDELVLLYERLIGDYADLEERWYRFLEKHRAFLTERPLLVERFFHDPSITAPAHCICDLCMAVEPGCALENVLRIGGGRWAVYPFDGEIRDIFETLQGVFSVWLPQSGYRMTRRYGLNLYRRIDRDDHRVALDLCIPIS